MSKKVFIGVGHGGSDPGAQANGYKEKDFNLDIALACGAELARHGIDVKYSRVKDENDTLTDEIQECNLYRPNLAIDVHNNAGGGDGIEVYHSKVRGTGERLANNIIAQVCSQTGQNSRGAKTKLNAQGTDYFGFIRQTAAPAVIVECAFLDTKDVEIIDTYAERVSMGIAIAHGAIKTLNMAIKPVDKPVDTGKKLYRVQVGAYVDKANADKILKKLKEQGYDAIIKDS